MSTRLFAAGIASARGATATAASAYDDGGSVVGMPVGVASGPGNQTDPLVSGSLVFSTLLTGTADDPRAQLGCA